jgi:hypothetical protein
VQGAQRQWLKQNVPTIVSQLQPIGTLAATNQLQLAISLPLRNQATLSNLLQQIYDPASTNYHHYLTPEQFTARFGPTEADYQALLAFAGTNGFQVTARHPNRMLLDVKGSVTAIENAFHLTMRVYPHPTENRNFYAPDTEPSLALTLPVLHISGLNNYALPRPRLATKPLGIGQSAMANAGSGPGGTYRGTDFRAAYVPGSALTGSGQSVGLLQFDGYTASDISYYESQAGLPNVPLQNVLVDGASGLPSHSGGEVEVSLDIEMAVAMAPGLEKIIVYMAPNPSPFVDILNRMATDNLARQLSCSWYVPGGTAEPAADQIFQEMAAQGQSFFNASGDNDAYTGLISFPGDTPYITQVGGTTLTTTGPGGNWVSESVWNWGGGIGSGGGISTQYPIPNWQTNIDMTASQGSATMRNTPDVALTADQIYVRANAHDYNVGGTSCAAPLWAGFAALVNQQAAASGRPAIGFINPALAVIAGTPGYALDFHDITTGNNTRPGSATRFYATIGYDLCTGWGTPAGQKLIDALANPEPLQIVPTTGFTSIGGVGGPFTVTSQTFALTNYGTNILSWSLASTSVWLTASPDNGTLSPGGPANIVTVSLNSTASNLLAGTYTATLSFTNLNDNFGQDRQFSLAIISPPTITRQPTNQAALDGETVSFSTATGGGWPQYYQWQFNSNNLADGDGISGTTTTNLTIVGATMTNAGAYRLIASNAAGVATSTNAILSIVPSAPVITQQPADQTVVVDGTAQFAVAAVGTKPIAYQWSLNGTNIDNATNAVLTLPYVQFSQAGVYAVMLTNIYGVTNSSNAVLTVTPCAPAPVGIVSWWAGEDNALDQVGGNNGTLVGDATYGSGEVGGGFALDGSGDGVQVSSNSTNLWLQNFTIETWIKRASAAVASYGSGGNGVIFGYGSGGYLFYMNSSGNLTFSKLGDASYVTGPAVTDTNWHHVAITKNGSTITFYLDGVGYAAPAYNVTFTFAGGPGLGYRPDNGDNSFYGSIDELSIYSRALPALEVQDIYLAGNGGKCFSPTPPSITSQPLSQTNYVGQTASFNVAATGTLPLNYQWSFNGTNIDAATNSTLTLPNVQFSNAGIYSVMVGTPFISTFSSNAVLTVNDVLDHFAWNQIPSPQFVGIPFYVTIQAIGTTNEVLTNFTGTVLLSSTNGISVVPPVSGVFTRGLWIGAMTLSQPASNLVLRADSDSGQSGMANPILVFKRPMLNFTTSGNFLLIFWPVDSSNFVLESSTALNPALWVEVANPPVKIGDQYLQSVLLDQTNRFYRLRYVGF